MASYLRPRRGKRATAESQNIILKRGEVFFEAPTGGVGTGTGRIKVGDGTTAYTSLPYFLDPDNFVSDISTANITFTETSETNNTTLLNRIVTGAGLNTIVASTKNLLSNLNGSVTQLNNDIDQMQVNFQAGVEDIYDACIAKGSTPASTSLSDVVAGIMAISTGIIPSGTINITSNGTKDVTQYASAKVNVPNSNSTTYTATTRSSKIDLGAANTYRYLVTNSVPNSNSGTYTASSSSTALDMGATNTYRYVNTSALTKVSGTKSITANGNSQNVASYQYVNVNVPNSNSGTYTASSRSSALDMGAANSYRYVNTNNVPKGTPTYSSMAVNRSVISNGQTTTFTATSGHLYLIVGQNYQAGTAGYLGYVNASGSLTNILASSYVTITKSSSTFTIKNNEDEDRWIFSVFDCIVS